NLILLNLLLLMIVTLVPFTTALVGPYLIYPDRHVAVIVYNGLYLLMALAFHALWHYARHRHHLLGQMIDQQGAQSITDQYRFGPLFYLLVFALSWIYPPASLGVNLLLAVFYALPFSRKHKSEKIPQHPDTTQISPENDQQEKNVPR
ncbi:MAG: hypothetical protein J2P36_31895, partial [Ktedonobacteraceae bacterium]|nr:hypothetical protein [Ktedonobacteraceae bacterium]